MQEAGGENTIRGFSTTIFSEVARRGLLVLKNQTKWTNGTRELYQPQHGP